MKRLLICLILIGCSRSSDFLEPVPPPPPPPPRFEKVYKFNLSSSEKATVDVDILWVIDNSGSMGNYQQRVIANSAAFMKQFRLTSKLNWRMGLLSTSIGDNPYMGFASVVDWQTIDAEAQFNTAVARLGVGGDSTERSFEPIVKQLKAYPKFLRPGAFLLVILVSDEVESSYMTVASFRAEISKIMGGGDGHRFATFGVYSRGSNDSYNNKYADIVAQTGGKTYNLEANDYGELLANLGQDLVQRTRSVNPVILLDQRPLPDTISVVYKGRWLRPGPRSKGGEWSYDPVYNLIQVYNPQILDANVLDVRVSFVIDQPL